MKTTMKNFSLYAEKSRILHKGWSKNSKLIPLMKLYQVDAFTTEIFSWNPAGVMILDAWISDELMQKIASEMNLSETAFTVRKADWEYDTRFFTPESEIDLCWHATLSTAHILFSKGIFSWKNLKILTKWWELHVEKNDIGWYTMNFPTRKYHQIDIPCDFTQVTWIESPVEIYDVRNKWKIVVVRSLWELEKLSPNFWLMKGTDFWNVVVTCNWDESYDYYMRAFVTDCGINEDPVTGSIECVLALLWAQKLWKNHFHVYQASKRWGEKQVELVWDRVKITGQAVTVFDSEL